MKRYEFSGKTVLITGASMGIGAVFARELARRGAKLILVARSEDKLKALAAELGGAEVIAADLSSSGAAEKVFAAVNSKQLEVDVLINNAGFGLHGRFDELARDAQREAIDLNCGALVELSHVFLPMLEKRRGGIIQIASMAGYVPAPYMAVYGATKAFVLSFSAALWAEYRARGVRVTALSPGATESNFFARAGEGAAAGTKKAKPEDVVRAGLDAFAAGRPSAIPGASNRFAAFFSRLLTRSATAKLTERMTRPKKLLPAASEPAE